MGRIQAKNDGIKEMKKEDMEAGTGGLKPMRSG